MSLFMAPRGKTLIIYNFMLFGPEVCRALPFFNAFTGCDTVSKISSMPLQAVIPFLKLEIKMIR